MTKEWQEASNQRAKEQKINPITGMWHSELISLKSSYVDIGISSEDYKGQGFVTTK